MPSALSMIKTLYNKGFGGTAVGATGNLAGDLSQQIQALVDRIDGTVNLAAATGSWPGSLPEQLQYLYDRLISTTDLGSFTASATGSLGEQLAYLQTAAVHYKASAVPSYYMLPAAPADGVSATAGASAYGSWVQSRAASGNALYIVGVCVDCKGLLAASNWMNIGIGTGAAASEVTIADIPFGADGLGTGAAPNVSGVFPPVILPYPLPVAASTRIAVRSATANSDAVRVTLLVVDQASLTVF